MGLYDHFVEYETLDELNAAWADCSKCLLREFDDGKPVGIVCKGIGNEQAKVMVVGKGPTKNEAITRAGMMTDRGGKEIRKWFKDIGSYWKLRSADFYFTNIVKCPHAVRDPNKEEYRIDEAGNRVGEPVVPSKMCGAYLENEISIIKPDLIIAIGSTALSYFAKRSKNIPSAPDKARMRVLQYKNIDFIACTMPISASKQTEIPLREDYAFLKRYRFGRAGTDTLKPKREDTPAEELIEVFKAVDKCQECQLYHNASCRVFGTGDGRSNLLFVGEAPGAKENEVGSPFQGPAGEYLRNKIFSRIQVPHDSSLAVPGSTINTRLDPKQIYITNAVKCWPGHRNPEPTGVQIDSCRPHLRNQIRLVDPKVIVCLGKIAAQAVIGQTGRGVGMMRNRFWKCPYAPQAQVIVTWHPSYGMRQESMYKDTNKSSPVPEEMIQDIQKAVELAS